MRKSSTYTRHIATRSPCCPLNVHEHGSIRDSMPPRLFRFAETLWYRRALTSPYTAVRSRTH
eukprot:3114533-Prorocentrum_lima.AAC.1